MSEKKENRPEAEKAEKARETGKSKKKSIHEGHRRRLREEFRKDGMTNWPEHRALELLLCYSIPQRDVNEIAHNLIERFGDLSSVLDAPAELLEDVDGVGEYTSTLLHVVHAIHARYTKSRVERYWNNGKPAVETPEAAWELFCPYFESATVEKFCVLSLNGKYQFLGIDVLSEGCARSTEVNLLNLNRVLAARRPARIYVAHNHVTQNALPSWQDIQTTQELIDFLWKMGVYLEDHLILVENDMVSIRYSRPDLNWR